MAGGSWRFDDLRLGSALERWRADHSPTDDDVEAFYEWAMAVTESGPPDRWMMPTGNEDEYVSLVPGAGAFVTYVAVGQDRSIFVRSVEPDLA